MKLMTVLGTRPEIIRLSRVIALLDACVDHVLVHTGQNYDDRLDGVFFRELDVRAPDIKLGIRGATFGAQIGQLLPAIEGAFLAQRPDRLLILGDTNSGLSAVVARRLGIPVFHMEAGNRCFDDRVPEEVNRRIIDHSSTVHLPYTERSRANLLREGMPGDRVFVTGNPIKQVLDHYAPQIDASDALHALGVEPQRYFLATVHRAENVDRSDMLRSIVEALGALHRAYGIPVLLSVHPRMRAKLERDGVDLESHGIRGLEPLGFFDFVRLEREAFCLLSDSGTVQEEGCILGVPNVTLREVTERPETIECGSNYLAGRTKDAIIRGVQLVTAQRGRWNPPPEYIAPSVAETVVRIATGFRIPDAAEQEWSSGSRYS